MYLYIRKTRHVFKSKVYTPNHCLWVNQILHASDILAALALVVKDLIVGKKTSKARLEQAWIILWATSIINCSPFLSIPNISNIDIDQCIPSWQMWQMWHSMANVNIFWHFHGKILTFIRVPDPRFEEDCQGLQAPELAIAHPIGGFLECHGWCWNTKHLRQVDGRFLTWNAFPFSWSVFQSGHISFAIRQRFFVAQAICSVRQWQCQLNGNDTFKTFPFAICFFFPFLSWVVAVSFPSALLLEPEQEACAAEGFGPENNGYWPPYRLLDHSFSSNAGPPKKVGACYWWCVTVGGFGLRSKHL